MQHAHHAMHVCCNFSSSLSAYASGQWRMDHNLTPRDAGTGVHDGGTAPWSLKGGVNGGTDALT